jgi:hypothetical protein
MVLAFLLVLLSGGSAFADGPRSPLARCSALLANGRALVDVAAEHLFSDELVRLVRLGLTGRVQVEVALIRHQPFWFDAVVLEERRELAVAAMVEGGGLLLDGSRELREWDRIQLDRLVFRPQSEVLPEEIDRYRVEVKVKLQVITAASLRGVAQWIASGRKEEQGAVSRRLLDAVANDLTREASARCDVELATPKAASH